MSASSSGASSNVSGNVPASRAPALIQQVAELLSLSSEDLTISTLSTVAKGVMKLRDELFKGPLLDDSDFNFLRRGLGCAIVAAHAHRILDNHPTMCDDTLALLMALIGLLLQHKSASRSEDTVFIDAGVGIAAREACVEELRKADHALRGASLAAQMQFKPKAVSGDVDKSLRTVSAKIDALLAPLEELVRLPSCKDALQEWACAVASGWSRLERLRLVVNAGRSEFDSLGVSTLDARERVDAVRALLRSSASEAGQMVAKDLFVSFKAPLHLVGHRRTLLMSQSTATLIAQHSLDLVTDVHRIAQKGGERMYDSATDADQSPRVAAVLTALAIAIGQSESQLRRGDAFGGRVQLPFLCTRPPKRGEMLLYIEDEDAWLLLRTGSKGRVEVAARRTGAIGLETLAINMAQSEKQRQELHT